MINNKEKQGRVNTKFRLGVLPGEGGLWAGWAHRNFSINWVLGILYVHITIFHTLYKLYVYVYIYIFYSISEIFHNNKFLFKIKQCSDVTLPEMESLPFM